MVDHFSVEIKESDKFVANSIDVPDLGLQLVNSSPGLDFAFSDFLIIADHIDMVAFGTVFLYPFTDGHWLSLLFL